jgi:hypothetical protein
MFTLLLDLIISVLLFRKKTPAVVVVVFTVLVFIVAIAAIVTQAQFGK